MNSRLYKITSILFILVLALSALTACGGAAATKEAAATGGEDIARPSNPGGAGKAVDLTGDAAAGAKIYVDSCTKCHGDEGKGGVENAGAEENVPELNPIDSTLISTDAKTYATNLDLFIEHGSTPGGANPAKVMTAFGDEGKLTPQQIADVIAYVISLNK